MASYSPDLQLDGGIEILSKKPLDVRTVVESISNLTDGSISYAYAGLVVNIKGTSDLYILTSSAKGAYKVLSNWQKVGENICSSITNAEIDALFNDSSESESDE